MNKKHQIIIVSHCFFNDAAKLKNQKPADMEEERSFKRAFLTQMLSQGIEFIQLPCPEFILYGSNRWEHAASQFNTPHFRREAEKMLEPVIMQLEEYYMHTERYEILGIMGIDGSSSCGVNYTFDGNWGGELGEGSNFPAAVSKLKKTAGPGVFMEVFKEMLRERKLPVKFYSLDTFTTVTAPGHPTDSSLDLTLTGHKEKIPAQTNNKTENDASGIHLL